MGVCGARPRVALPLGGPFIAWLGVERSGVEWSGPNTGLLAGELGIAGRPK